MDDRIKYFPDMIVDLEAIQDDLVANGAPIEAIRHVQNAIKICRNYKDEHSRRYEMRKGD